MTIRSTTPTNLLIDYDLDEMEDFEDEIDFEDLIELEDIDPN